MNILFTILLSSTAVVFIGHMYFVAIGAIAAKFQKVQRVAPQKNIPFSEITVVTVYRSNPELLYQFLDFMMVNGDEENRLQILIGDASDEGLPEACLNGKTKLSIYTESFSKYIGKSDIQNALINQSENAYILFCDIEFQIEKDGLAILFEALSSHPSVGISTGIVDFKTRTTSLANTAFGQIYRFYRKFEINLRYGLSLSGLLAKCDGMCVLVRRSAFRPLPRDVGEDQVMPLVAASIGFRTFFTPLVVGSDFSNQSATQEIAQRRRMTARAFRSTHLVWPKKSFHPRYFSVFLIYILTKLSRFIMIPLIFFMIALGTFIYPMLFAPALALWLISCLIPRIRKISFSVLVSAWAVHLGIWDFIRNHNHEEVVTRDI